MRLFTWRALSIGPYFLALPASEDITKKPTSDDLIQTVQTHIHYYFFGFLARRCMLDRRSPC